MNKYKVGDIVDWHRFIGRIYKVEKTTCYIEWLRDEDNPKVTKEHLARTCATIFEKSDIKYIKIIKKGLYPILYG